MKGLRNLIIFVLTLAASTWIALVGIKPGVELLGLASVIGAVQVGSVGAIFGRGYNKKVQNGQGTNR